MAAVRVCCVHCGAYLQGRAFPEGEWGTWCARCWSWWPDDRGVGVDAPPPYTLVDSRAVPVQPVSDRAGA